MDQHRDFQDEAFEEDMDMEKRIVVKEGLLASPVVHSMEGLPSPVVDYLIN